MDKIRFIIDLIMSLIALYLLVFFIQSYRTSKNRSFLLLAVAFAVFLIVDVADNIVTNILALEIFSQYYVHDIIVVLILATLAVVIRSGAGWKQPLRRK